MIKKIDTKKYVPQIYRILFYYALLQIRIYKEFVLKGGRGSLKSTIAALITVLTTYLGIGSAVCIRRYQKDVRKSCRATCIWVIKMLGIEEDFYWSDKPQGILQIKCLRTGLTIDFEGLDDADKLKSYAEGGGIGCVWVEECQMLESMDKIRNLQQTFDRGLNNVIFIFCFNPKPFKKHWCNTELLVEDDKKFILHTSYLDVPKHFLGESFHYRAEKLKERNLEQYLNEYMGEVIGSKGKVFRNVRDISKEDIEKIRLRQDITGSIYYKMGLDFGFAEEGDPSAFTIWRLVKEGEEVNLYCLGEHVENAIKIDTLANVIRKKNPYALTVYADHNPLAVEQLTNTYGINLELAYKHNMRERGFQFLANDIDNIYICEELTTRTYEEFTEYTYVETKDGDTDYSQYPKKGDHTIDSCRYALTEIIRGNEEIDILRV